MPQDWTVYACLTAGLVTALVAGVFLSFSDFIMRALSTARPVSGIDAMQEINRTVYRSVFLVFLLGLAPLLPALAVLAAPGMTPVATAWVIAGSAAYLVLVFLVTIAGNVPMNKRLDRLDTEGSDAATYWKHYRRSWTRLNHLRTVGSAGAAACLLIAATVQAGA